MGIKGLPALIKKIAGEYAMKTYNFDRFHGMTIAVDASLLIYQTVIAMRSRGKDLRNDKGELTSHLHGVFHKVLNFLQNGMIPIFVFDGKAPAIKQKTIDQRTAIKNEASAQLELLDDSEDEKYIKYYKQTYKIDKQDIMECKILLDLIGIPYIVAPEEADVVCAWLASRCDETGKKYAKGVCSDDSDMLTFGAAYLFKDMVKFIRKGTTINVISLNRTLKKMKLSQDQFIDLCVLLGCDYCDNVKGIGPATAYKLITTHGSLEKVIKATSNKISKELAECMITARDYFKNAPTELDKSKKFLNEVKGLKLRKVQRLQLIDFMCVKHNFDVLKLQADLQKLEHYYKELNVSVENTGHYHDILEEDTTRYLDSISENAFVFREDEEEKPPEKIVRQNSKRMKRVYKVTD